MARVITRA